MKRLWALAVGVGVTVGLRAAPCRAAGSAGADPFNFLFLDAGARAVAMGGAYTALARDSNALLYNPAGLGRMGRYEATFMHNQYFAGINQEYASVAAPQGWAAELIWMDFANVARTTLSNPDGAGLGTASSNDLAFGMGYGKPLGDSLSVGAGVKLIRESLDGIVGQGYGLDLGALYAPPTIKGLTLGAAVQNIGPSVKFQSANEDLPLNVRAGAGYQFPLLEQAGTLSVDVLKERRDNVVVAAGGEVLVAKMMPVRLGYNTRAGAGPGITAGLGFLGRDFLIDYAFVPFGDLGNAHRISATVRWGGLK